ncbi:MAG: cytochrome c biogenesis protein ResB, partial [Candidatus Acidiferrales bacterium]
MLGAVRTGIVLLILIALASIAGTLVLQRPLTDPADIQNAYSPATLRWLDATGLTDVFHARWFIGLLALLSLNIVLASLERFPGAWSYVSRPYLRPTPHFLSGLPMQQEIEVPAARQGLEAAERALASLGLRVRHIGVAEGSLFAERHRWARLAPYLVHASLLLILAGGIVDAIWGYRGFVALTKDQTINQIELRNGNTLALPFALRCDAAGQENYPDGTPRRWWSQLAVLENGREVLRKEIAVNDPLVHRGLRFFQSSYGSTGEIGAIRVRTTRRDDPASARDLKLALGERTELDAQTSVLFAAFIPDFVVVNNRVETRSNQPNNPAIRLMLEWKDGSAQKVWLFPKFPNFSHGENAPYGFEFQDMETGYYTGLQVAYEPGQWAVWTGAVLMVIGLIAAFYMVHIRFWVVPLTDACGRTVLWVGGSAAKNREEFEQRFRCLVEAIRREIEAGAEARASAPAARPA